MSDAIFYFLGLSFRTGGLVLAQTTKIDKYLEKNNLFLLFYQ